MNEHLLRLGLSQGLVQEMGRVHPLVDQLFIMIMILVDIEIANLLTAFGSLGYDVQILYGFVSWKDTRFIQLIA